VGLVSDSALHVRGLLTLGARCDVELYFLAFLQCFETCHNERGKVDKQVFTAFVGSDKAKTLRIIKTISLFL